MKWRIIKTSEVPLGARAIGYGSQGRAVRELQEELTRAGFFSEPTDGLYGPLTEEAVRHSQKAFGLRPDGIAGSRFLAALRDPSRITGRRIYTVKNRDNLQAISERFGVTSGAWVGISGRGNPRKGIYPGMQLLLYEKALLVWDQPYNEGYGCNITGRIRSDWRLGKDTQLNWCGEDRIQPEAWHLIAAEPAVWEELLGTVKAWPVLAEVLARFRGLQFGLDLRELPVRRFHQATRFIKFLTAHLGQKTIPFVLLSLGQSNKHLTAGWFWESLAAFGHISERILIEPLPDLSTVERFISSSATLLRELQFLVRFGLNEKTLLICTADGWDWEADSGTGRPVHFKKGRALQAMNPRSAGYDGDSMLRIVHYITDRKGHCLIYRDITGWSELLRLVNRRMLAGVVVQNFNHLGKIGPQLIADSFAVLPRIR